MERSRGNKPKTGHVTWPFLNFLSFTHFICWLSQVVGEAVTILTEKSIFIFWEAGVWGTRMKSLGPLSLHRLYIFWRCLELYSHSWTDLNGSPVRFLSSWCKVCPQGEMEVGVWPEGTLAEFMLTLRGELWCWFALYSWSRTGDLSMTSASLLLLPISPAG